VEYVDIKQEDLLKLRDGLEILDRLNNEDRQKIYLYGISQDPVVLDAAREAIAESAADPAITEESIQLAEVGVSIPLSADGIYALTGSGLKLDSGDDEFAYRTEGEGVRVVEASWSRVKARVTVADFTRIALASDGIYLNRFLAQRGTNTPATVQREVKREAPATTAPAPTPGAAPATAPQMKQTSSKRVPVRIKDIVEDWLG
jgi:hypothetical protein